MASTCVPTPTLTTTDTSTSTSFSTTSSETVTTEPGSVSTSVWSTCTVPEGLTTTCLPTLTSSVITLPGNTSTVTVPVTVPVDVPITQTITLWGSSCSTVSSPSPDTSPPYTPPTPSATPSPPSQTSSSSTSSSIMTSITTSITTSFSTSTSTTSSTLDAQTSQTLLAEPKRTNNTGPIVGGVLGGIVALLLLGFLTWKLIKKQSRFDDFFNRDDDHTTASYRKDPIIPEPKPYDYGIVGHQNTNPVGLSPPNSPPPTQGALLNDVGGGYGSGGNDVGYQPSQPPAQHLRNASLTPLLAGVAAAATTAAAGGLTVAGSSRPGSSRPSSSSSSHPLGPLVSHAPPSQGYPPVQNSGYPPALQNWTANQGHGQSFGTNAAGPGAGQTAGATAALAHNTSVGSNGSGPSIYSMASWDGGSLTSGTAMGGGAGGSGGGGVPGIIPVMAAAGMTAHNSQRQQEQRPYPQLQQYDDPFARNGSPVSFQEQRILQVTNAEPAAGPSSSAVAYDPRAAYGPSSSSYGGGGTSYSPYAEAGASSSSSGGAHAGPSSSASTSTPTSTAVDGKGRPVNTLGGKAPLVHLDGGMYQEPEPGAAPPPPPRAQTQTPSPPAYAE